MTSTPASSAQSQAFWYASQLECWGRIWTPILIFAMHAPSVGGDRRDRRSMPFERDGSSIPLRLRSPPAEGQLSPSNYPPNRGPVINQKPPHQKNWSDAVAT